MIHERGVQVFDNRFEVLASDLPVAQVIREIEVVKGIVVRTASSTRKIS